MIPHWENITDKPLYKIKNSATLRMNRLAFFIFCCIILISGCIKEDKVLYDPGIQLRFSTDTILFDTTFTTIGSATRILKIYNDEPHTVKIDKISIAGTAGLHFNFNVDGNTDDKAVNILIPAKDSIYLFCRVKVDPDQSISLSPFVLEDNLVIDHDGHTQQVALVAWGQNANYITNKDNQGRYTILTCDLQTVRWDDPKPYIIYGTLVVDSCTLEIPAGARVYFHGGLVRPEDNSIAPYIDGRIIVFNQGKLNITGTTDNKVIIGADRLESAFANVAGQWGGIAFRNPGKNNHISNVNMKNSTFGLYADSASILTLDHSAIYNTTTNGLLAINAKVIVNNSLFYNTLSHSIYFTQGGDYSINYTTVYNPFGNSYDLVLDNFKCTAVSPTTGQCLQGVTLPAKLQVKNSIFTGNDDSEIIMADRNNPVIPDRYVYNFTDSYIKGDSLKTGAFSEHAVNCIYANYQDIIFTSIKQNNYTLDSTAIILNKAKPIPGILDDISGNSRDAINPDPGCFERK